MYNTYLVPVCYIDNSKNSILKISATSLEECKEKIIDMYQDKCDEDNYNSFVNILDREHDIIIGDIIDLDTV